jgi:hypothetical protein
MSVRRPQRDCVLCMNSFDEDMHRAVFHARQESASLEEAVTRIAKLGIEVTPEQLRLHVQYHRPLQPAPRTRFRPEEALERAKRLPERQQALLMLVGRVPALSGTQLAEIFYWNGQAGHLPSARAACYRDLSKLVRGNFLYRWYPPVAAGPAGTKVRAWQHRLTFYFLGRDASPLVSEHDQYETLRGRDWFVSPEELSETHDLFALGAAAEAIVSLGRQAARRVADGETTDTSIGKAELKLEPGNWYGAGRLAFPTRAKGTTISGLACFSMRIPKDNSSLLAPFLYEYDDGLRPLGEMAEQVLRYIDLKRAGAVGARFPDLRKAKVFPPVLVVAADPFRLESLRRSVQTAAKRRGATSDLPIIICSDQSSVHAVGLTEEAWVSVWDAKPTPRRYRLPDVFAHQAADLQKAGLEATSDLVYSPDSPMPQLKPIKEPLEEGV